MPLPTYRPITPHDRKYGVSAMATAAAMFTVAAWGMIKNDSPSNVRNSWLIMALSTLLFFSGQLWLVMNYRYSQRPWWRLVGWGGSCSGGATGLGTMIFGAGSLLPVACGMMAWTMAVAVVLVTDRSRESARGRYEQVDVPEYAVGTPHDPRTTSRQYQHDLEEGSGSDYAAGTPHNPRGTGQSKQPY